MAIDTRAKRASCLGIALLALRTGPPPDGSNLGASERQHVEGLYVGIAASAPPSASKPAGSRYRWGFRMDWIYGPLLEAWT